MIRILRQYDPPLLFGTLALLAFGLVVMASASAEKAYSIHGYSLYFFFRQLAHIVLALAALAVASCLNLEWLRKCRWLFFAAALLLLILVAIPGIGQIHNGSQRWISLGFISFHASDIARTFLLIFCAGWLSARVRPDRPFGLFEFFFLVPLVAICAGLMIYQPDFGAAVVLMAVVYGMLFLGGMRLLPLMGSVLLAGAALSAFLIQAPYRVKRLQAFMDPLADAEGSGFQQTQSWVAIGSSGIDGSGLGNSIQKMSYLPEAHNDFIFSILAEELGFFGVAFAVFLYLLLITRILSLSMRAREYGQYFASLLCAGIGVWLATQTIINVGVATSLLPVKGISLPMVSYGGTNMLVSLMQIGLVLAAARALAKPPAPVSPRTR